MVPSASTILIIITKKKKKKNGSRNWHTLSQVETLALTSGQGRAAFERNGVRHMPFLSNTA